MKSEKPLEESTIIEKKSNFEPKYEPLIQKVVETPKTPESIELNEDAKGCLAEIIQALGVGIGTFVALKYFVGETYVLGEYLSLECVSLVVAIAWLTKGVADSGQQDNW